MCAISCRITTARSSRAESVTRERKMNESSLSVTTAGFSMASKLSSGTKTWSYLANG